MNGRKLIRQTTIFNRCADGLGIASIALTGTLAWMLLIRPIDAAIGNNQIAQEKALEDFERHDEIAAEAARLRIERTDFEARLKTLLDGIPESVQDSQFLGQVATLARESELLLEQFRPGNVEEAGEYQQLEIELTASGTHTSICRFLDGLQRLPRMCRVPELHIDASKDTEVFPVSLKVLIFFATDDAKAKTGDNA